MVLLIISRNWWLSKASLKNLGSLAQREMLGIFFSFRHQLLSLFGGLFLLICLQILHFSILSKHQTKLTIRHRLQNFPLFSEGCVVSKIEQDLEKVGLN